MRDFARWATGRWLEFFLAAIVFGGLVRAMLFLYYYGYLPQPYFYDAGDTWMDWFNTTTWARDQGIYDSWQTIYPPLSFVFLRIFGLDRCLTGEDGGQVRDCDWLGVATLHGFFILNIILIAWSFYKIDRRTALPRSFALAAGLPMTIGLDRGNLVVVCFTFFLLAYGPLLRSARLRWLSIGMAVNFKVYLIASIFPQLLRRRWRWFEGALLATLGVYLVTFAILGMGTPYEIYRNIEDFTGVFQAISFLDLWYAGTYIPALSLLSGSGFPILIAIGSDQAELWPIVIQILLHGTQAMILLAAIAAWMRPEVVPMYRLTNFGTAFALITSEAGGYTQTMILFLTLMEPWRGGGRRWAIVAAYILCMPIDFPLYYLPPITKDSYLGGYPVILEYAVTFGPFVRPALILSIPFALACVTFREVWGDIRTQGWKSRHRFRRDLPLLSAGGMAA